MLISEQDRRLLSPAFAARLPTQFRKRCANLVNHVRLTQLCRMRPNSYAINERYDTACARSN